VKRELKKGTGSQKEGKKLMGTKEGKKNEEWKKWKHRNYINIYKKEMQQFGK
jgi:hypothetical protein